MIEGQLKPIGLHPHTFEVGDVVLFDHFGAERRPGRIVKITKTTIHIEWTAPSSGATRVVAISTKMYEWVVDGAKRLACQFVDKNIRKVSA